MANLHISEVSKSFGTRRILDRVSLDVASGEVVVLMGRSGSGKSTLLRCVTGLTQVDSGEILVDGKGLDYRRAPLRARRLGIGFVFQSLNLFPHLTVAQNLALAPTVVARRPTDEVRRAADEAIARVGLADKAGAYPSQLSGGQQQRAAIARAIVMAPKVMLFDEITSALDPELIGEVLVVVGELARSGMTILMVTHEVGFARRAANRIAFLSEGRICEIGPPDAMLNKPTTPEMREFVRSIR